MILYDNHLSLVQEHPWFPRDSLETAPFSIITPCILDCEMGYRINMIKTFCRDIHPQADLILWDIGEAVTGR